MNGLGLRPGGAQAERAADADTSPATVIHAMNNRGDRPGCGGLDARAQDSPPPSPSAAVRPWMICDVLGPVSRWPPFSWDHIPPVRSLSQAPKKPERLAQTWIEKPWSSLRAFHSFIHSFNRECFVIASEAGPVLDPVAACASAWPPRPVPPAGESWACPSEGLPVRGSVRTRAVDSASAVSAHLLRSGAASYGD